MSNKKRKQVDYEDMDDSEEEEEKGGVDIINQKKDHDFALYTRLGLTKDATAEQIKRGYKFSSLRVHPDKNPNDPDAAKKFQEVNEAYVILSDEKKRKRYDLTGEIDDDNLEDLINKWRFFYKEFTTEDIDDFAKSYKNSVEEQQDLINFYEDKEGDLTHILQWIPLSENSDVDRFIGIFEKLIKEGVIEDTKRFWQTRDKVERLKEDQEEVREAEEAKGEKRRVKKGKKKTTKPDTSFQELQNKILAKRNGPNSNNFLSSLASKYCQEDVDMGMPSEEEFQKIQANIGKKKENKAKAKPKGKKK